MTLDSKLSKAVYQGNGSTTVFPFAFKVWDSSHIAVTVTDAAGVSTDVTSNSTVTLTSSGGSVTYPKSGSPLPSGAKLAITRNMPFTQGINLTTASRFDPQVLEDGLDQATAERQQTLEMMARAVILPATSNESPQEVVQSIYASRDAAAASANEASAQATAADASAQASAASASNSHDSALAAAQSAADAAAASGGLAPRMDAVEAKNATQDTRLTNVEAKNTTQDNSIAANTAALATKTNTDMSNLTTAGKQATVGLLKKKTAIALSFPWGGGNLSALPADGWLTFKVTGGSVDTSIEMDVGGPGHSTRGSTAITTVELTVWAFKGSTPYFNASPWGGQTFSMTLYTVEGS